MILAGNVSIIFFVKNICNTFGEQGDTGLNIKRRLFMKYLIRKPDTFMNTLNEEINSILKRSFDSIFPEYVLEKETKGLTIPVDIKEFDNEYKIRVEVPGIKKENIDIELNKSYMTISAKKEEEKEEKNKKYHKTEFAYGNYSRTIYFPQEIDIDKTKAKLEHGVLKITAPKMIVEKDNKKKLTVE